MDYTGSCRFWSGLCFYLLVAVSIPPHAATATDSEDAHARITCLQCHRPEVKKVSDLLRTDVEPDALCTSCHRQPSSAHYTGANPFIDSAAADRGGRKKIGSKQPLPLCIDCHVFHAETGGKFMLSKTYLQRAKTARNINPHWNNHLCLCCHQRKPDKKNSHLREDGNADRICNRCHSSKYAPKNIHPVGMVPSRQIQLPPDMPLQENRLSCFTCHDPNLQMGLAGHESKKRSNPFFLRRESLSRNGFCFICHLREAYQRMNPHVQLDEQGNIREETCIFCHPFRPDVSVMGPEHVDFIVGNPDEYCMGCHHGFARGHPAGIDHLRRPSKKILRAINASVHRIGVALPLFQGKIICATCHNPHQQGVLKIRASAAGSQRTSKLRLMPGNRQCLGCHRGKQ